MLKFNSFNEAPYVKQFTQNQQQRNIQSENSNHSHGYVVEPLNASKTLRPTFNRPSNIQTSSITENHTSIIDVEMSNAEENQISQKSDPKLTSMLMKTLGPSKPNQESVQ